MPPGALHLPSALLMSFSANALEEHRCVYDGLLRVSGPLLSVIRLQRSCSVESNRSNLESRHGTDHIFIVEQIIFALYCSIL